MIYAAFFEMLAMERFSIAQMTVKVTQGHRIGKDTVRQTTLEAAGWEYSATYSGGESQKMMMTMMMMMMMMGLNGRTSQ